MVSDYSNKIKVGVLAGGVSKEREISLLSGEAVFKALNINHKNVVFIDICSSKEEEVKKLITASGIDVAFIALHGEFGEDGRIQAILEDLDVVYTGSSPKASFLAMDKELAKDIFVKKGILTPSYFISTNKNASFASISYPVVIKPALSGSSLGTSIVKNPAYLDKALKLAFSYNGKILCESYIEGRELTVGILNDRPLSVVEIVPKQGYYDFDAKYTDGKTDFVCPASLDKRTYKEVQEIAFLSHKALGCRHFSRVDMRLGKDNRPYVLEINSIPGLTAHSLLPLSAKASGITFEGLVLEMIRLALYGKKETQKV